MSERPESRFERRFGDQLRHELDAGLPDLDAMRAARTARRRRRRGISRTVVAAGTVLLATVLTVSALQLFGAFEQDRSGAPPADDVSAIVMVAPGESVQVGQVGEELLGAFDRAYQFALDHPDDIGWPWVDPVRAELVLSAATPQGRSVLDAETQGLGVPVRIREVKYSVGDLRQIQEAVTRLRAEGVVDADLIFQTLPDERDNRTLIALTAMSEPLIEELARRFGGDAIAIRIDPTRGPATVGD